MTSGQTQSFNPGFIILLAPVFAFFWLWLDRRGLQPSTPTKMALGLFGVVLAFGVMWPAAHSENGASSVSLASIPPGVNVDEEGAVFTVRTDDGAEERIYYGAGRLTYDTGTRALHMNGVLPDLDRLRLLSASSPSAYQKEMADLAEKAKEQASQASIGQEWEFSQQLASIPDGFLLSGEEANKVISWVPESGTLTVTGEIQGRAEVELLAAGANPDFRQAVDQIYVESSMFRVSVWWLVLFYMLLTMGELCLSPVGLSLVTKLAPAKHVGLFMGGWFLATAVAEWVAQVFGAYWGKIPPMTYFLIFVCICGVGALFMAVLVRPLKRMMHGVK